MMPRDTNPLGSIFGGVILSLSSTQAGAIGARREVAKAGGGLPFLVTVAMQPGRVQAAGAGRRRGALPDAAGADGPNVDHDGHCSRGGARRRDVLQVTEAEVVYVGIDPRRPPPADGAAAACGLALPRRRAANPASRGRHRHVIHRMHICTSTMCEVGQEWESLGRTVTETDIVNFAGLSGDFNPIHMDHEFCQDDGVPPADRAWPVDPGDGQRPGH